MGQHSYKFSLIVSPLSFVFKTFFFLLSSAGMWTWPGTGQATDSTGPVTSAGAVQGTAPQQHELTDMLQMLDQTGATSFEDLNMFNTGFE